MYWDIFFMLLQDLFEMSSRDLRDATYAVEWLFKDLKLDVVWSTHFQQRVMQDRETEVRHQDVIAAFSKLKAKYGPLLVQAQRDHKMFTAVLKDLSTELNIPFSIHFHKDDPYKHQYKLHVITIMRKDPAKFKTNVAGGDVLVVEEVDNIINSDEPDSDLQLPKPTKIKKTAKKQPTTDKATNSLIKTLWYYNAADVT